MSGLAVRIFAQKYARGAYKQASSGCCFDSDLSDLLLDAFMNARIADSHESRRPLEYPENQQHKLQDPNMYMYV